MNKIYQVVCNSERKINQWLRENADKEIVDIKANVDESGELITVIYKIDVKEETE